MRRKTFVATTDQSLSRRRCNDGAGKAARTRCTSSQAHRGRMESLRASTEDCVTSCCRARFSNRSLKQSISAIAGDWITTIGGRSVRWAIKRRRNLRASVMKRCYRWLNEHKSRRRLDMWTDETRIPKSHKGWSLCGVPVNIPRVPAFGVWEWTIIWARHTRNF